MADYDPFAEAMENLRLSAQLNRRNYVQTWYQQCQEHLKLYHQHLREIDAILQEFAFLPPHKSVIDNAQNTRSQIQKSIVDIEFTITHVEDCIQQNKPISYWDIPADSNFFASLPVLPLPPPQPISQISQSSLLSVQVQFTGYVADHNEQNTDVAQLKTAEISTVAAFRKSQTKGVVSSTQPAEVEVAPSLCFDNQIERGDNLEAQIAKKEADPTSKIEDIAKKESEIVIKVEEEAQHKSQKEPDNAGQPAKSPLMPKKRQDGKQKEIIIPQLFENRADISDSEEIKSRYDKLRNKISLARNRGSWRSAASELIQAYQLVPPLYWEALAVELSDKKDEINLKHSDWSDLNNVSILRIYLDVRYSRLQACSVSLETPPNPLDSIKEHLDNYRANLQPDLRKEIEELEQDPPKWIQYQRLLAELYHQKAYLPHNIDNETKEDREVNRFLQIIDQILELNMEYNSDVRLIALLKPYFSLFKTGRKYRSLRRAFDRINSKIGNDINAYEQQIYSEIEISIDDTDEVAASGEESSLDPQLQKLLPIIRQYTAGKRAWIVGGDEREHKRRSLQKLLQLSELEWAPSEQGSIRKSQAVIDSINKQKRDIVIILLGFCGHCKVNSMIKAAKNSGIYWIPVQHGHGEVRIIQAFAHYLGLNDSTKSLELSAV